MGELSATLKLSLPGQEISIDGLVVTREEPALRQRLRQVEFRELWRPKPRIWSMNEGQQICPVSLLFGSIMSE